MHMEKPYSSHSSPRPLTTLNLWFQATRSSATLFRSKLESQQAAVLRGAAKLRGQGPEGSVLMQSFIRQRPSSGATAAAREVEALTAALSRYASSAARR